MARDGANEAAKGDFADAWTRLTGPMAFSPGLSDADPVRDGKLSPARAYAVTRRGPRRA